MSPFHGIILDPVVPMPLVLLLAMVIGGLTIWVYARLAARLSLFKKIILTALRLGALALVLLILLQPSRIENIPAPLRERVTLVALDSSRSMKQPDAQQLTRFEAARNLIWDAGLAPRAGALPLTDARLFTFDENAQPITHPLAELQPAGKTTQFHDSIETILSSLAAGEGADALFLLTDGHDFQLVNSSKTALAARNRQVPIYAVPFGGEGVVRDVSTRITSFEPFHYANQTIRIAAVVRPLGCPYETLNVTLLREGQPIKRQSVIVHEEAQVPVKFEVIEPKAGQFEYEIQVAPLSEEVDTNNNSATTYVNVIDQKIRVLVLEGEPYWDTTFLQRSLRRNDKLDIDSIVRYARDQLRIIRTEERKEPFAMPTTPADWRAYNIVILGKAIDQMLSPEKITALEEYVDKLGGVVVFSRADAFSSATGGALQPVSWGALTSKSGPLKVGRAGLGVAPFKLLADAAAQAGQMPDLLGAYSGGETKPLAATFANVDGDATFPAMIHRRYGAGQVLSIGVDGLWRWAFNAKTEGTNTVFDRFWDQTVLWLMNGSDFIGTAPFTLRADTANVLLGESIHFRIVARSDSAPQAVPLTVRQDNQEVARLSCVPSENGDRKRLLAEFVPKKTGRYIAEATLPDGTTQTVRFIAYEDNVEETDVAADPSYLRQLCEASGGRVIRPDEFAGMLKSVKVAPMEEALRTRKITLWDRAWLFWLMGALFGGDWYLRRRWGLC